MPELPSSELEHARLLWSGEPDVCVAFAREHDEPFHRGYTAFRDRVPRTGVGHVEQLATACGKSLGYGFLNEHEQGAPRTPLSAFLDKVLLADVLLTSACLSNDAAANEVLAVLINDDIRRWAQRHWRTSLPAGVVEEIIDNMPSTMYQPSRQGLNASRPRLQSYYGRCTLFGWLQFVAQRALIDRRRRNRERPVEHEVFDGHVSPRDDAAEVALRREATAALRRAVGRAFQRLWDRLAADHSLRQQEFAYLKYVEGLSHSDIADRLSVGLPRITELAQIVCSKFLRELKAADAYFADIDPDGGGQRTARTAIEQIVHELLHDELLHDELLHDELVHDDASAAASGLPTRQNVAVRADSAREEHQP